MALNNFLKNFVSLLTHDFFNSLFATILTTSLFSLRRSLFLQGHTLLLSFSKHTFLSKNCFRPSFYSTMASPDAKSNMSIEDIESKISALTLLKAQKLAEVESKKSKKDKKKEKSGKLDVKVPKVCCLPLPLNVEKCSKTVREPKVIHVYN